MPDPLPSKFGPFCGPNAESLPVILASGSASRRRMLVEAGVTVEVVRPGVDEDMAKASLGAAGATPDQVADSLAELKATRVSGQRPDAMVIGADQVLALEGAIYDKPADRDRARAHLSALQGRSHTLVTSAVVMRGGQRIWGNTDRATLHMRHLPAETIELYLDAVGDTALESVGAYQLEGLGAHLFSRVEGDFFTILGLPLLPLLGFLRQNGVVPA